MYNVHHLASSLGIQLLKSIKHDSDVFVETGTNTGKGIETALEAGFKKIISLEIEEKFVSLCKEKFKNESEVYIYNCDSGKDLLNLVKDVNEKMLFWLDGHADYSIPLLNELEQIKKLKRKDHIILIDDVRMFGHPLWCHLSKEQTIKKLHEINNNYNITYANTPNGINDLLIASTQE